MFFAHMKGSVYKIKIYEMGSDNGYVDLSIMRWASFVSAIDEAQTLFTRSIPTRSYITSMAATTSPCLQTSSLSTSGKKLTILFFQKILVNASLNISNVIS